MKLLKLTLSMFKGIKEFELDCNGKNCDVYGDNAVGKTTLKDALTWLLFDKNSEDKKDFGIMRMENGTVVEKTEPTVEGIFCTEDGTTLSLKKVYKEKWSTPHGQLNEVMTGHTTDYFIDGVSKAAGAYKKFINSIIDEKRFKVLTEPRYFNEKLSKEERRAILLDIVGGVDQTEIINLNSELSELGTALNGRTVEDFKLMTAASLKKTKKQIDEIAPAIRECENMKPPQDATNMGLYEAQEDRVRERIALINNQIAEAKAGKVDKTLLDKYNEKCREKAEIEKEKANRLSVERRKLLSAAQEVERRKAGAEADLHTVESSISKLQFDVDSYSRQRESLIDEFKAEKAKAMAIEEISTVCPVCGQDLPLDRIESAKHKQEEAVADFNLKRSEKLKAINDKGKAVLNEIVQVNTRLTTLTSQKEALEAECKKLMDEAAEKTKVLNDFDTSIRPELPEVTKIKEEIAALEQQINTPDADVAVKITELEQGKAELQKELSEAQENIAACKQAQKIAMRIRRLKEDERDFSETFMELQKMLFLCDEYTRKLTEYIDSKVAEHFKIARFRLFRNNVTNEGVEDCCDVMMDGKPYESLNAAAQVEVGLDIINTLTQRYGLTAPVMIDNAESYTRLPDTGDLQVIRLIVSAADKELRVEQA